MIWDQQIVTSGNEEENTTHRNNIRNYIERAEGRSERAKLTRAYELKFCRP